MKTEDKHKDVFSVRSQQLLHFCNKILTLETRYGQGGIMVPLRFSALGLQKSKAEPWPIFGTKHNLKRHFGQF